MISINDIRSKPEKIKDALKSRGYNGSINDIITIDEKHKLYCPLQDPCNIEDSLRLEFQYRQ